METLERIEDCENVVGGDPEDTVGEEGKTPSDTQHATESQDDYNLFAMCARLSGSCSLEKEEPGQYDDEGSEGEDEDQNIVAYVNNVVHQIVGYPAPLEQKDMSVKDRKCVSIV